MGNTTLVTREQEHQTATSLYGDKQALIELFDAVRKVAPWANSKQYPMSDNEIALAVRRAVAMGLDPLNQHEVQIWKDKRGSVNFQPAYTLVTEWVKHFKGEHTEPRYHRLDEDELKHEGLAKDDVAYRCTFMMKSDIPNLRTLIDAGFAPAEAREMLEVSGLGVATSFEYNGEYFAPAARSRSWKVEKRALTDAYRRKFGMPNRSEIEELRRILGTNWVPEDWEGVEEVNPAQAATLAAHRARHREHREAMETDAEYREAFEQKAQIGADAMYGDGAYAATQPQPAPAERVTAEIVTDDEPAATESVEAPHWIEDEQTRKRFWAWTSEQGLSRDDVHKALGVEHVSEYGGDKTAAVGAINTWISEQVEAAGF